MSPTSPPVPRPSPTTLALTYFTVGVLIVTFLLNFSAWLGISDQLNTVLTLLGGVLFVFAHGSLTLGWKRMIAFCVIAFTVSFISEVIGVATGLIFGRYHYTDHLGPKILGVPPLIQCGYIAVGYASLMAARMILGAYRTPRTTGRALALAVCAAFLMVSWDVAMDPYQSTISGDWIWHDGGSYFGVGLHNYAGWFGTVLLYQALYMLWERRHPVPELPWPATSRAFWSEGALYYGVTGLGIAITPLVWQVQPPIASPENYSGPLPALQWSLTLIAVFVMGTPVALALARAFAGDSAGAESIPSSEDNKVTIAA